MERAGRKEGERRVNPISERRGGDFVEKEREKHTHTLCSPVSCVHGMFVRAHSVPEFITSYRRNGVGEERLSTSKWGNRDKNTEIGEGVCFFRVVTRL